ncbi:anillin, actin binding protein 2 isoform 2-T2 [Pholidichthys leucotaenia]
MDAGEEHGGSTTTKRRREPLSDSEDNICPAAEMNNGQKRPRLEATGQENCSPQPSISGRMIELEIKPDTPIVPSVRSRVQQLTQRREGRAPLSQRCMSDRGGEHGGFQEHLLGEGEFHQRLERFKGLAFQTYPTTSTSSATPCLPTRSNFVFDIQQKLQDPTTPSSKQATRVRQEREQELSQLPFKPISENVWLKRSSSDSSLTREVQGEAEQKDGSFTQATASAAVKTSLNTTVSDGEMSFHNETNTCEMIDQMFEEVLEYAEKAEDETRDDEDNEEEHDSGIGACSGYKDKLDTELEKERSEGGEAKGEGEERRELENNGDELLAFPPSVILSPLSKSVEAAITPLRLAESQECNPSLLLTPEGTNSTPAEAAPLYSINAYRTQRQTKLSAVQSVTPGLQRRAPEASKPQPSVNIKEKITALNEEAVKLQTVINQTLQALSCCTDEEHGRGSLEEAEAEKLLLISCEKRLALLAEVGRLKEERSMESGEDAEYVPQQPCRGTVSITNIQLPLKVEYVCSSHNCPGRPSHYFFILIRYGPCNIVATPLATAADAQHGDTISFPTSVTLKDIRSSFEIDVEVYSLSNTSGSSCTMEQTSTKSRVTPKRFLNTLTRSSVSLTSTALPAVNTRRSSNFCLVGCHKITLASLGLRKFPLDKVPFLSPLEGNIYLQLDSKSHSDVQHQGFLTMFKLVSGYGVWHRCYFALEECNLYYWNHPNDKETKEAEGIISLSSSPSQCVRPVKRDLCARPFTFELVSSLSQQQEQENSTDALAKCWFSVDTKEELLEWMEKLNQVLLDFHTWTGGQTNTEQSSTSSSSGNLRESIL